MREHGFYSLQRPLLGGYKFDNAEDKRPDLAGSRRPGVEIHPWSPNGDLRPTADIGAQILQRLLSVK